MDQEHEIVLYQAEGTNIYVNVMFKEDTFWMTQKAMADLFECTTDNISLHLKNIYKEEELDENSTTEFFSVVQKERFLMSRILKVYDKSIFSTSEHFIKVEFPFSMPKDQKIIASGNENGNEKNEEQKALEILKSQPAITAKEMACQIGVSTRTIGRVMKNLRDKGMISRVGSDRKGYWEIHEE